MQTPIQNAASHPTPAPPTSIDPVEVVLITLGGQLLGIPLNQTNHIVPMPADFVYKGNPPDHFLFQGKPVAYISLWDQFAKTSEYAEFEELRAILPQRCQDHLDWLNALEDSIRLSTEFAKARNPRECAFGKWYYSYHAKAPSLSLLLTQFESPHTAIHELANRLLTMAASGDRRNALKQLNEARNSTLTHLIALFDSAQSLLKDLQRRVAVIVGDDKSSCALGADGIRDILSIPYDRLVQSPKVNQSGIESEPSPRLIVLNETTVVPLLEKETLRGLSSNTRL